MKQAGTAIRFGKRAIAMALAFFCVAGLIPWQGRVASAADVAYGRVTADNVKVRKSASTSAAYWFKLPKDWASEILDTTTEGGILWYKVKTNGPTQGTRTYIGYIHGDYYTPMTAEDQAAWLANPVQPGVGVVGATASPAPTATATPEGMTAAPTPEGATPTPYSGKTTPIPDPSNLGRIHKGGVNFREKPSGKVIQKLDNGTVVELLEIPAYLTADYWFKVSAYGKTGYIQADLITIYTKAEAEAYKNNATYTPPTAPPQTETTLGYIQLTDEGINLRETAGGKVIGRIDGKPVLAYLKQPLVKSGVTWYYVKVDGIAGYVHGGFAKLTDDAGSTAAPTASPTPGPTATAVPAYGYIQLTEEAINLRATAGGKVIGRIDGKPILAYSKQPVVKSGVTWYYVTVNGISGYVHGGFAKLTDNAGNTVAPTASPTPGPTSTTGGNGYGYIKLLDEGINLRKEPAGAVLTRIDGKPVIACVKDEVVKNGVTWYCVTVNGVTGYVHGGFAARTDDAGATASPTATPSPKDAAGYAMVMTKTANLRKSIGGSTIMTLNQNTVWPMVSAAVKSGAYTWFPVNVNGTKGFLRSDASSQLADFQVEEYLKSGNVPTPTPSPSPTPGPSKYLITTDKVHLRKSASKDATAVYTVEAGTVIPFSGSSTAGGVLWYKITYMDSTLWVMSTYSKVMNTAEYEAWLAGQPTASPSPSPSPTPSPEDMSDMAETSMANVLVRASGSSSSKQVTKLYKTGTIVTLTGSTTPEGSYTWYGVKLQSGTAGFIRGDLLRIYTKDEKKAYEDANNPGSGGSGGLKEATYDTLRKGSTGEAVKALQAELKTQGYFKGTISGTYGTDTVEAVQAFQKAKGLTVDGIAGANTQHALYGTVPVGSGDDTLTNTIYDVEKIDWWTGNINTLWARGKSAKVTDVKTGITFWARRWAGGYHVDAEPLTAADTRRMCKIYGVSTASQITYQRRALWVTIGTRTFAASMYGVPHNYPEGDTIANNDFKGQFCIHFTNSKTHAGNRVDPDHTAAIQYAYDTYWNKK